MMTSIILAGFGGQGILFAGKQLAKTGMYSDKQVSWLPSYGPEMRGGTANCSVIISDTEIGSPLVTTPDVLIALNIKSFDTFESQVKKGGVLIADSSLITRKSLREDINSYYIPATGMASNEALDGLANVIMLGKFLAITKFFEYEKFLEYMIKSIPASKSALIEKNTKALKIGFEY